MNPQSTTQNRTELTEVNRLLTHIQASVIDSEQTPIRPEEVPVIANLLIEQLIWQYPYLDQVLQELLDNLHFQEASSPG
ncbi:MAG: hypothetical protein F6K19_15195 [Cyanothece sp. SIO1E1]|nr:hypothetical protein [Cyanothece sp. SIO1E1]